MTTLITVKILSKELDTCGCRQIPDFWCDLKESNTGLYEDRCVSTLDTNPTETFLLVARTNDSSARNLGDNCHL
jgi:hypothetical protein